MPAEITLRTQQIKDSELKSRAYLDSGLASKTFESVFASACESRVVVC